MNDQSNKPTIDIGDIIGKVRKVKALIKEKEAKFEEEIAPLKEMEKAGEGFLLKYLNDTNQKSAGTTEGGCHKILKTTYQVRDGEKFKKFVIENQIWTMIVWRANDATCEEYAQANKKEPPGTFRNAVELIGITAPPKPKLRKKKPATLTEEEWAEIEKEVDAEQEALEAENGEAK